MTVKFGIFDHIDRGGKTLDRLYDERLQLVEKYESLGFDSYFVAEHHATPLGTAPSPGIFLSSVAQRTKKIKFGPLVYLLPLYNPLRLIWEICMLDQLSKGRFQLGIGRGISVFELAYHNINPMHSRALFQETLDVVLLGLREKVLNYQGRHLSYADVPMELEPVQKPHPPLWAGVNNPQSALPAAKTGTNALMNAPPAPSKKTIEAYISTFRSTFGEAAPLPNVGIVRMIYIGATEKEAHETAARAYASFYESAASLYRRFQTIPQFFPPQYETIKASGVMIAGTAEQVGAEVAKQLRETGANYFTSRFAFGDLTLDECLHSVQAFAKDVVPLCQPLAQVA
jgi:alkanesulfonate monooxygenase SsuD/methylene tetrahydromethanopterin reductase-like flavin-dependent oxidoreductase (luciferase family)